MHRGFAPILIILLGLTLAVLGSITYLQLKPQSSSTPQQSTSPKPTSAPTDETVYTEAPRSVYTDEGSVHTEDPRSANWETHRNEDLGFQISYPSGWFVYDDRQEGHISSSHVEGPYLPFREQPPPGWKILNWYLAPGLKSYSLSDVFSKMGITQPYLQEETTTLGGVSALSRVVYQIIGKEVTDVMVKMIVVPLDYKLLDQHYYPSDYSYFLAIAMNPWDAESEKIFNQILSTFQFLN